MVEIKLSRLVDPPIDSKPNDFFDGFDWSLGFHEYTIDWTPDSLAWSVDRVILGNVSRESTWNSTANRYNYPQTPARVQISIWPAGLATNKQDLVTWAGGLIDWNSPNMTDGYYYVAIDKVTVDCSLPPTVANVSDATAYVYTSRAMNSTSVAVTNQRTGVSKSCDAGGVQRGTNLFCDNTIPGLTIDSFGAYGKLGELSPTNTSDPFWTPPSINVDTSGSASHDSSKSSLSTGAKVGIGVAVSLCVIAIAAILAFVLLRRRKARRATRMPQQSTSEHFEKPELGAGEVGPGVQGPLISKAELQSSPAADTPWFHAQGGYLPPELHSTMIAEASTGTWPPQADSRMVSINQDSSTQPPQSSRPVAWSPPPSYTARPQNQQVTAAPAALAEEADILVQELGLINMRKKALKTEATSLGVQPEERKGRKGEEWRELLVREQGSKQRLEEIEAERQELQQG